MHAGGRRPPPKPSSEARAGGPSPSSPPLPRAGGGGGWGQSIMVDSWFHLVCGNTIPVRSKRSLREGQRSNPEPPSGATLRSQGATLRSHPQSGTRVVSEWYQGGTWYRFILDTVSIVYSLH